MPTPESLRLVRITGWLFAVFAVGLMVFDADLLTRSHVNFGVELSQLLAAVGTVGIGGGFVTLQPAAGRLGHRLRQQPVTHRVAITVAFVSFIAAVVTGAVAVSRLH